MASGPGYQKDPGHTVALEAAEGRWIATRAGDVLADSARAQCIREDGYPPVIYFPSADVRLEALVHHDKTTYCPFKGKASYRAMNGVVIAWCYETPYDEVAAIAGHIAFFADQVEVSNTPTQA